MKKTLKGWVDTKSLKECLSYSRNNFGPLSDPAYSLELYGVWKHKRVAVGKREKKCKAYKVKVTIEIEEGNDG